MIWWQPVHRVPTPTHPPRLPTAHQVKSPCIPLSTTPKKICAPLYMYVCACVDIYIIICIQVKTRYMFERVCVSYKYTCTHNIHIVLCVHRLLLCICTFLFVSYLYFYLIVHVSRCWLLVCECCELMSCGCYFSGWRNEVYSPQGFIHSALHPFTQAFLKLPLSSCNARRHSENGCPFKALRNGLA